MFYNRICRKKGGVETGCDVYVSKTYEGGGWKLQKSKWAIPAHLASLKGSELLQAYRDHIVNSNLIDDIYELAYQTLGCWCKDQHICHACVLIDLTQQYMREERKTYCHITEPRLHIYKDPIYRAGKVSHSRVAAAVSTRSQAAATTTTKKRVARKKTQLVAPRPASPLLHIGEKIDMGSVPMSKFITKPMIVTRLWTQTPFSWKRGDPPPASMTATTANGLTVIYKPVAALLPPKQDLSAFCVSVAATTPLPTPSPRLNSVVLTTGSEWPPVICYIARITRNKTTKQFQMILSEKISVKATNDNSIRVHVVSQMEDLLSSGFFAKDDLIRAKHYSVSTIGRKKLVLLAHAEKFVVATN